MTPRPGHGTGCEQHEHVNHVLVLADDFSGACDTGVVFTSPATDVLIHPDASESSMADLGREETGSPAHGDGSVTPGTTPGAAESGGEETGSPIQADGDASTGKTLYAAGSVAGATGAPARDSETAAASRARAAQSDHRRVDVFHTDTRKHPATQAAAIAAAVAARLPQGPHTWVYQKIDSTMRGSVGAEVDAVLTALGRDVAVVCPTFPATGRTVEAGRLLVDGQPISTTDYGRDPRNPIDVDTVAGIVRQTNPGADVQVCTPSTLPDVLASDVADGGRHLIAVDAASIDDLAAIAGAIANHPTVLPVGSAGLARALAHAWGLADSVSDQSASGKAPRPNNSAAEQPEDPTGLPPTPRSLDEISGDRPQAMPPVFDATSQEPVRPASPREAIATRQPASTRPRRHALRAKHFIVASGSANPRSLRQLAVLEEEDPRFVTVRIDKSQLLTEGDADQEIARAQAQLRRILSENDVVAIALSDERQAEQPYQGTFESFVATVVADAVNGLDDDPRDITIEAGGADTCLSVCHALGIRTLAPQEEVVSGLPWSIADNGLNILSKAGGFGDERALLACARFVWTPSSTTQEM